MNRDIAQYVSSIPLNGSGIQPVLQSTAQPMKFVQGAQQVSNIAQQVQQVPQQVPNMVPEVLHPSAFTTIPTEPSFNSLKRGYQANQQIQIDLIPSLLTPPASPATTLEKKKPKPKRRPEPEPESESETESEPEPEPVKKAPPKKIDVIEPETTTDKTEPTPEEKKEPVVIETPKQQPVQTKSILKPTPPVVVPAPGPVPVINTPQAPAPRAPTIVTEAPVSKVAVPANQEDEDDDGDCCGCSWRCCTITWGVLFGLALAGLIACAVIAGINANKASSSSGGCKCNLDYIKTSVAVNGPSGSIFSNTYYSTAGHLGNQAPNTVQFLLEGAGQRLINYRPLSSNDLIVWQCGCRLKITYTVLGSRNEVWMGDTMTDHTDYTFFRMQTQYAYTIEMQSCSYGYTFIAISPTT